MIAISLSSNVCLTLSKSFSKSSYIFFFCTETTMGSGPAKSIMYIECPEVGIKSGPERPIITRAELAIQSMFQCSTLGG